MPGINLKVQNMSKDLACEILSMEKGDVFEIELKDETIKLRREE